MYDPELMIEYEPTKETDAEAIESLLDRALGPTRKRKTAYRLRAGSEAIYGLSYVARDDGVLRGTISFWPLEITGTDGSPPQKAILLGPLAVEPEMRGQGIGVALMRLTLDRAEAMGHDLVILVGDLDYYSRVGFQQADTQKLVMPGPVEPDRLLFKWLKSDRADAPEGKLGQGGTVGEHGDPALDKVRD